MLYYRCCYRYVVEMVERWKILPVSIMRARLKQNRMIWMMMFETTTIECRDPTFWPRKEQINEQESWMSSLSTPAGHTWSSTICWPCNFAYKVLQWIFEIGDIEKMISCVCRDNVTHTLRLAMPLDVKSWMKQKKEIKYYHGEGQSVMRPLKVTLRYEMW